MKTITLFLFMALINFTSNDNYHTSINDTEYNETKVVFDGYEGGYYFFTNEDSVALQLEVKDHFVLADDNFENGDYIGKSFLFTLKEDTTKDSLTTEIVSISYVD